MYTKIEEQRIVNWLRIIADHIEKGGSPYLMCHDMPEREPDKPCQKEMVETFSVTLSKPWGG